MEQTKLERITQLRLEIQYLEAKFLIEDNDAILDRIQERIEKKEEELKELQASN